MIRAKYSILATDSTKADYFLYGLEWSKKYEKPLRKVGSDDLSVIEIIEVFAKVPVELDYSEPVYSHIYSKAPYVYLQHSDFIQYIVESLMQEYYLGIERIIRILQLDNEYEYVFVRLFDPSTALIRVDRKPDLRFNERLQWQNISRLI